MVHFNLDSLQLALNHYGYWFLMAVLLLENAGLPLPGEAVLLVASYMSASHHGLYLPYIIGTAIVSAVVGDNIGFLVGLRGGRPLLDRYGKPFHITDATISNAEERMKRHGAVVVFGARFFAGIRVIAGPMAGALHMPWRRFALFNFLGATAWVVAVSSGGYFAGSRLHILLKHMKQAQGILVLAVALTIVLLYAKTLLRDHAETKT